jgi:MFS family permease
MSATGEVVTPARGVRVIALVGIAHFMSHFYMLVLPPLFPLMRESFGVGYTELGLTVTVFSLATGLTQAPVGFLVDRYGPRAMLIGGLAIEGAAFALIGAWPSFGALVALMGAAGLANAVYHPADYTILNATVPSERMGRAFSLHTFAGYLGNAVAPVVVLSLAALAGWRLALVAAGVIGIALAGLLLANAAHLDGPGRAGRESRGGAGGGKGDGSPRGMALLLSAPVLMGLLFFVGISVTGRGISNFGVAVLTETHAISIATAGVVLSVYLFASPLGVLVGGWIADRIERHARFAGACFVVSAAAVGLLAITDPPLPVVAVLFGFAGFAWGAVAPSRDLLVRSMAPPGEMGKVFGFVSTGFNIGGVVAPPMFGYVLDHADPRALYTITALVSLLTVATVLETGRRRR